MNTFKLSMTLLFSIFFLLAARTDIANAQSAASTPETAYLFTSFRGNGDGLHLAYSKDGLTWVDLDKTYLTPTVGGKLFRDPHILRGPDGVFRLVWTTGWKDNGIGYASSTDLVHWSEQRFLPVMKDFSGVKNCWVPETFYDEKNRQYIITWSSDVEGKYPETVSKDRMNNRTYYVTTKDFEEFSEPKIFLDPGFDHIDATMFEEHGKYVVVFKEGDMQAKGINGPIHSAIGDSPTGPFTLRKPPIITQCAEGPALVKIGDKTLLYLDFYTAGRYGVYESTDGKEWKDISSQASVVPGQKHGTIFTMPGKFVAELAKEKEELMAKAPKPILDGFTADPAIRVFGDTYYVYPTSDKPNWMTTDFSVWSSKNLIDWKKEGMILDVTKELSWANIKAWAPDCIERDGKYYFYFCADGKIGVATADKPTGPFKDALDKPLIQQGPNVKVYTIDPYPFIDDDGQAYLYFGNGTCNVFELKPDMITLDGDPKAIRLKEFREGIVVFKRNGLYYFMWSVDDVRSDNYRVAYGTSKTPFGPVDVPKDYIVLHKNGIVKGTGHHSVVNVPGTNRWYIVFHRHAIPDGNGYKRETCIEPMLFNEDETIKSVDPAAAPFPAGSVGEPITNGKGLPEKNTAK